MKKEQVLELMNAIPPDLIEEADVTAPKKRRMPKVARMGLIAACLCIALLGTAAAARSSGVWILDGFYKDHPGVKLVGGMACYPIDVLSEEVRALEGAPALKSFRSWEDMEKFIGVNLMDNPVLEASPAPDTIYIFKGIKGRFFADVSAQLRFVQAIGYYKIDDVDVEVLSFLYTERAADQLDEDGQYLGVYFPDETELIQETYTTASGLEAQIARAAYPEKNNNICVAAFSINGVSFAVKTWYKGDVEANRKVLCQVLDGFQI